MDIRIEHLTKRYGRQLAVDDVDFIVNAGEVLGFLGPNGAGKTTTMRMICGLTSSDSGRVLIGGKDVADDALAIRRAIGYLPESNPLYEDMPVLDLLRFGARIQGVDKQAIADRIREMVKVCGLEQEKQKRVGELSRGYRQRAGLALAMVHDPQVLILDEPTTGLDPNQIVEVRELIKELGKAKTVIFSTHILPEVEAVCDRELIISKGRITADGTPAQLRSRMRDHQGFLIRITGAEPERILSLLRAMENVSTATVAANGENGYVVRMNGKQGAGPQAVMAACIAQGLTIVELRPLETALEDVFRDATLN